MQDAINNLSRHAENQPMLNADGIGQPALDGIENVNFWGFWAQNHQKMAKIYSNLYVYLAITFSLLLYPQNISQMAELNDNLVFK